MGQRMRCGRWNDLSPSVDSVTMQALYFGHFERSGGAMCLAERFTVAEAEALEV